MRLAIRFALFALCLCEAAAQTPPDVAEILKKVGETYRAAKSYELVGTGSGVNTVPHVLLAFQAPNRFRMEGAFPAADIDDPDLRDGIIIHDGSTLWAFFPKSNQYASLPASALTPDAPGDLGDMSPGGRRCFCDVELPARRGFRPRC